MVRMLKWIKKAFFSGLDFFFLMFYFFLLKMMKVQGNLLQIARGIHGKMRVYNNGILQIGNGTIFSSRNPIAIPGTYCILRVGRKGRLSIGSGCRISTCNFYVEQSVTVGDHVFIGANCHIFDTNFHSLNYEDRIQYPDRDIKTAPVVIEDGAFLGAGVTVMKGITIGKRAVIGAGSVVRDNVGPDEIWAGNPACFVRKIEQTPAHS